MKAKTVPIDYAEALKERLVSRDWPEFENPDFLVTLDDLATEAAARNTLDGALASLGIRQQILEECTKVLLRCSRFYIQLRMYPAEIEFHEPRKATAGIWIKELEESISFDGKQEFLAAVSKVNELRNLAFHSLARHKSTHSVLKQLKQVQGSFDTAVSQFEIAYEFFMLCFKDERKNADETFYEDE
jgi:hypothetical protein